MDLTFNPSRSVSDLLLRSFRPVWESGQRSGFVLRLPPRPARRPGVESSAKRSGTDLRPALQAANLFTLLLLLCLIFIRSSLTLRSSRSRPPQLISVTKTQRTWFQIKKKPNSRFNNKTFLQSDFIFNSKTYPTSFYLFDLESVSLKFIQKCSKMAARGTCEELVCSSVCFMCDDTHRTCQLLKNFSVQENPDCVQTSSQNWFKYLNVHLMESWKNMFKTLKLHVRDAPIVKFRADV